MKTVCLHHYPLVTERWRFNFDEPTRTRLEVLVSKLSFHFLPINLLLVQNHQAEIGIAKYLLLAEATRVKI